MAYLNPLVLTSGLDWATTNGVRMHLVKTAEPTTYANVTTNTVGVDTITTGSSESATSGLKVVTDAVTAGTVTDDAETAAYWALTGATGTLVAAGPLSAGQVVYTANTWTLGAVEINLKAAVAV